EGCAEVDEGARGVEPSFPACKHLDPPPEPPNSPPPPLPATQHAQRGADGTGVTPTSSERELLVGESTRFVVSVEESKAPGGPAAPGHAAWIVVGEQPSGLANL